MNTYRKTATIVGILFIIGTAAGILSLPVIGGMLGAPDFLKHDRLNSSQVALGALLMLAMGSGTRHGTGHAVSGLRKKNEALAMGYVIFRGALETFTTLALAICWLLLAVAARQYADSGAAVASVYAGLGTLLLKAQDPIMTVGGIVFGLGALILYYLLFQTGLIPRWISGWGIVAAVATLVSGLSAVFGTNLDILELVMLPQEMVMAVWLIAKGFNPAAIAAIAKLDRS